MLKRKYWGYILLVITAIFLFFAGDLLLSDSFHASSLIYLIGTGALLLHWFGAWVLMRFSNQNNNGLNLTGQIFNLIAGLLFFFLLVSGSNIDQYWNWMLSVGFLGAGFVAVFIAGAYETEFRLMPWIANFVITIWVVFSIFVLLQKYDAPWAFSLLLYGWLGIVPLTLISAATSKS